MSDSATPALFDRYSSGLTATKGMAGRWLTMAIDFTADSAMTALSA